MSENKLIAPNILISTVIGFIIMVAFGAIILATLQSGITQATNNSQALAVISQVFNNAWIAFSLLGVAVLIVICGFMMRLMT